MKKRIIKAVSIALGITTLMGGVNWILGTIFETIIGIRLWGGDVSYTYGFGIALQKLFPEYSINNPIESQVTIHIAPVNFILTVVVLSIGIYLICLIAQKCRKRKM